jgi:Flp pilus assembly protein TadD
MSLLLDALKKAELAKRAIGPDRTQNGPAEIAMEPVAKRQSLPDISESLEILSVDLTPEHKPSIQPLDASPVGGPLDQDYVATDTLSGRGRESIAPAAMDQPAAGRRPQPPIGAEQRDFAPESVQPDSQRAAARQVFEAKEMDYNPRRPFYITIGVLVVCAAGYAGYLWWQLQPRAVYNAAALKDAPKAGARPATPASAPPPGVQQPAPANPENGAAGVPPSTAPSAEQLPATPPTAPGTAQGIKAQTPQSIAPAPARPGVQTALTPPRSGAPAPATSTQQGSTRAPVRESAPSGQVAGDPPASRRGTRSPIVITPPSQSVDPQLEQAYGAFQRGDLVQARDLYQKVLQRESANRDALLGLAAIDLRTRDFEMAENRYLRLLEADPRDPYALAGMMAIRGQVDPVQSESRIKNLIAVQPESAHLHFALGNQYASQRRWAEAQAAFFKAYSLDSENPDFAFNLAVSLDQLHQSKPALTYYQRALALASAHNASFDKTQVSTRIAELSR